MAIFLKFYQHIPEKINPDFLQIGFLSVNWYAVMYLVAFLVVFGLLKKRLKLGEGKKIFQNIGKENFGKEKDNLQRKQYFMLNFLLFCFLGLIIGGRLGYVLFYNFSFYYAKPWAIISPFDWQTGEFIGIYGMSYHGGLVGAIISGLIFAKKNKINFLTLVDFAIPAIPAGYFFGRIGNFLNGELYGRMTNSQGGMFFPNDEQRVLRHPSQLYEAFLEGFLLFVFFWFWRNEKKLQGEFLALYFIAYALVRFGGEFFREPDAQIGFLFWKLTLGQLFSIGMFLIGLILFFSQNFCQKRKL